jgi:soluble lytic murein transglycosylase
MIGLARLALLVILAMAGLPARPNASLDSATTAAPSVSSSSSAQSLVDSARAELRAERPWHAAGVLKAAYPDVTALDPAGRLVLARAEAGARNWEGVSRALEGATWLGQVEGGEGWALLGRAREESGQWAPAADAYGRWLALPAGSASPDKPAIIARRMRSLAHADQWAESHDLSASLRSGLEGLDAWLALELARVAADDGEVGEVRTLLTRVPEVTGGTQLRVRGWDLEGRALLAAGDSSAAVTALTERVASLEPASRRGEAWALIGEVRRKRGDDAGALDAFRRSLTERPAVAGRAARAVLELGGLTDANALEVGRALERAGDVTRALQGYDRHFAAATTPPPPAVRLARAQLMAQLTARHNEAVEELRALSAPGNPEVGPVALEQWARLRERQGRAADVQTLRDWLIERYPASAEAANVVFLRGDAAHDEGDLTRALAEYQRVARAAPAQDRGGLARMRWAQLHLMRDQPAEAARVFEGYLTEFPTGRRWDEATYWAGRSHLMTGDSARARALLAELHERDPFGYYAMQASGLLKEPYRIDLPEGEVAASAQWVTDGLRTLELYTEAGLGDAVAVTLESLRAQARTAPPAESLLLSRELTNRHRSLDGINVALDLRTRSVPWSRRLLEAVYPFPLREAVEREAREWKTDPLLMAALIRQESAWVENIHSAVGAIGLMQVMPETGSDLFRQLRAGSFRADMLEVGDLNLHLGAAYMTDALARYGGDLPLTLSMYNAGPHRADRWKNFPEMADRLRFTERIPFAETRDYVKRVTRNRILYEALYGGGLRP